MKLRYVLAAERISIDMENGVPSAFGILDSVEYILDTSLPVGTPANLRIDLTVLAAFAAQSPEEQNTSPEFKLGVKSLRSGRLFVQEGSFQVGFGGKPHCNVRVVVNNIPADGSGWYEILLLHAENESCSYGSWPLRIVVRAVGDPEVDYFEE